MHLQAGFLNAVATLENPRLLDGLLREQTGSSQGPTVSRHSRNHPRALSLRACLKFRPAETVQATVACSCAFLYGTEGLTRLRTGGRCTSTSRSEEGRASPVAPEPNTETRERGHSTWRRAGEEAGGEREKDCTGVVPQGSSSSGPGPDTDRQVSRQLRIIPLKKTDRTATHSQVPLPAYLPACLRNFPVQRWLPVSVPVTMTSTITCAVTTTEPGTCIARDTLETAARR